MKITLLHYMKTPQDRVDYESILHPLHDFATHFIETHNTFCSGIVMI